MSTKSTGAKKRNDTRLIAQHTTLGIDAEGYVHHLDRDAGVVHRIDPETGARERCSDLAAWVAERDHVALGNAVDVYVHEYIGEEVGWVDRDPTNRDVFGGAF
ncbi:hypothetical protein [Halorubrum distributum]|uniref:hypothetical protein n=1 Tax=Halorubrum distributum TaxID=29283 RepID=UPI001EF05B98|nr:hypothetical protein [Halorubrum terrestre]